VSTIPANEPMNISQLGTSRSSALPTTTPAKSSISATEIPTSTETIEAKRIDVARTAAIAMSLISTSRSTVQRGRGHQRQEPRLGASLIALRRGHYTRKARQRRAYPTVPVLGGERLRLELVVSAWVTPLSSGSSLGDLIGGAT
jgi:hypothetical protein